MAFFQKKTPWQKEWEQLEKEEIAYLNKYKKKKDSFLNQKLETLVPDKLHSTLKASFTKAFAVIFENGTGAIEKTCKKEEKQRKYQVNRYAADLKEDKKSLKAFTKEANSAGGKNLAFAGLEGVGLGVLGIGLPDIPLFTAMILKSLYEIAMSYGYSYDTPEEKVFILKIIAVSLSHGEELEEKNAKINRFIYKKEWDLEIEQKQLLEDAADGLSGELLYMKFLQGIPAAGMIGGAYDAVYLNRIQNYGKLKYRRRFLLDRAED